MTDRFHYHLISSGITFVLLSGCKLAMVVPGLILSFLIRDGIVLIRGKQLRRYQGDVACLESNAFSLCALIAPGLFDPIGINKRARHTFTQDRPNPSEHGPHIPPSLFRRSTIQPQIPTWSTVPIASCASRT